MSSIRIESFKGKTKILLEMTIEEADVLVMILEGNPKLTKKQRGFFNPKQVAAQISRITNFFREQ